MRLPSVSSLSYPVSLIVMAAAMPVAAQTAPISLPSMPLAQALQSIEAKGGVRIAYDPDAVANQSSTAVHKAATPLEAVQQATRNQRLSVTVNADGSISVSADILVVAERDEAETSTLVRQTSTSNRLGQSLRDQPRNTQVISARLIEQQQAQSVGEALRNAGGVNVNMGTAQSGVTYSVRGFSSDGLVNGLPSTSISGIPAGATQSIANIERLEVLKGPDALLAGVGNLGGTINIVTKKPNVEKTLKLTGETGSYGLKRLTIDAGNSLNDAQTVSARIVAVASKANHNFGGYTGNEEYLFTPSLRLKTATTDIVAGISTDTMIYGQLPFTFRNPATGKPFVLDRGTPLFSPDQNIRVANTQFYLDAEQKVADWLTFVARGQHQHTNLQLNNYTFYAAFNGTGTVLLSNSQQRQTANTDAIDTFARLNFDTFGLSHKLVAGYSYAKGDRRAYGASRGTAFVYNFLNPSPSSPLLPMAPADVLSYTQSTSQKGFYVQDMIEVGPVHVQGALRRTELSVTTVGRTKTVEERSATTPSVGAVLDLNDDISFFASYVRGFIPSYGLVFGGKTLPNTETRNIEAGVKVDLMNDQAFLTASWFNLRQSNRVTFDPAHPGFYLSLPGQQGEGIDINLAGEILPGWSVNAAFTHTIYKLLKPTDFDKLVVGTPQDQYSLYTSYTHRLGSETTLGVGGGLFGRSSFVVDNFNPLTIGSARQLDVNATLKQGPFDLTLGVRNLFNRENYGITFTPGYIPYGEPRSVRLTLGMRFF